LKNNPQLELHIIGDWEQTIVDRYRNSMDQTSWAQIHFKGRIENLHLHLKEYALCLHCARGDAFPTSTIETVSAGIPTIVSEWTGTREIMHAVDPGLVCKLDITDITEKINWYFSLDPATRKIFSEKGRVVAQKYNEEDATELYRKTFDKICNDLSVGK
jgi:glycosyltransferase involved in cell wall biosynthesis